MRGIFRRNFLLGSAAAVSAGASGLLVSHLADAWATAPPLVERGAENLWRHVPAMKNLARELRLGDLVVKCSFPKVIAEEARGHCYFADLMKFSTGELLLSYNLNRDGLGNSFNVEAIRISKDEGQTFDLAYDVSGFPASGGTPRRSLSDGRIVGYSYVLKPEPMNQRRRLVADWKCYANGGHSYTVEPWSVAVEGLPRDVADVPNPGRVNWVMAWWCTDIVPFDDGSLLSVLSLQYKGDERISTVALRSEDGGRTWQYVSTVADADAVPDSPAGEGFDEPCLLRLEGGELMCISRVGAGVEQKLARTYSADGGRTWSTPDRLAAYSVAPQVLRLKNRTLILSTGRPGLFVWFSTDARGRDWRAFDLLSFHNDIVDPSQRINVSHKDLSRHQTTAYTAMVEVTPNRVFLVYDRTPFGWSPIPERSGELARIYLLELRVQRIGQ